MKKLLVLSGLLMFGINPSFADVQDVFEGQDINNVKAGISKFILSKGGRINHGESYESNKVYAMEQNYEQYGLYTYYYSFNLVPKEEGTLVQLSMTKSLSNSKAIKVDTELEAKILQNLKNSTKGRFLYGLGFEYEYYDTPNGKVKAPKGRQNGIKITAVKYDAMKKGIMVGDRIIKINGKDLSEIPINEFATALNAKSLSDMTEVTYQRGSAVYTVILTPRLSNTKVY